MRRVLVLAVSLSAALRIFGAPQPAVFRLDGSVSFGETGFGLRPAVIGKGWAHAALVRPPQEIARKGDALCAHYKAETDSGKIADVDLSLSPAADGAVSLSVGFATRASQYVEAFMLAGVLPKRYVAGGGTYAAEGKPPKAYPASARQVQFRTTRLVCSASGAKDAVFAFAKPTTVVIRGTQEGSAELRFASVYHGDVKKGSTYDLGVTVALGEPLAPARQELSRIRAGEDWVTWTDAKDIEPGSALDFSSFGHCDAPAGKYGWLRNVDGHFEFEGRPGVPVRFAGVNFCGTMNYPTHEETDRIVRRLKAIGYNSIRLHHHDQGLVKGSEDNLTFNAESLDRLDYLVAKAIENGLYVTTDLYVSRDVTWRQMGFDRDGSPKDVPGGRWLFKLLIAFHDGAYANWLKFATAFMTHVNPYTGRRYADEPGMPLLSMVNEASYRMGWAALTKEACFREKWRAWAEEKVRADPGFAGGVDVSDPAKLDWNKLGRLGDTAPAAFMADNEAKNFARQLADMRALGTKALFTSINHLPHYAPNMAVRRRLYGYFDDHLYVDHPKFPVKAWRLPDAHENLNPLQDPECRLDKHAYMKIEGIPATMSEFNFCGPNDYRNMNGLLTGAFMSGQDLSAYWRFAYSHAITNMYDGVGRPGSFDVASDPLNCAAERLVLALYLRNDFKPFANRVTLVLPDDRAATRGAKMSQLFPEWRRAFTWKARVSCAFPGDVPAGAKTADFLSTCDAAEAPFALPDADGFAVDRAAGTVRLATERTCGVSIGKGVLSSGVLTADVRRGGPMTTVGLVSVDGAPLATSGRMVLLHLTDAQTDGALYADASRKLRLVGGKGPTVIRDGEVAVRLRLAAPERYAVYGLDAAGRRTGKVETAVENGELAFTAAVRGARGARIHYEITRE